MDNYSIEWIGEYHQGVAICRSNGLYGVLLTGGNMIIPPKYDYLESFNNGYAQAIRGNCCVIIDLSGKEYKKNGNTLVPLMLEYDTVRDFSGGFACVKKDGKWGVINKYGVVLVEPSYDYLADFHNGVAKCIRKVEPRSHANEWGFINEEGTYFPCSYDEPKVGEDGFITLSRREKKISGGPRINNYYDYFDIRLTNKGFFAPKSNGETVVLRFGYDSFNIVRDYRCGLSCINNNTGLWGAINEKGDTIVPFEYLSLADFHENLSFARNKQGKITLISTSGRVLKVLDEITDYEHFHNNVAIVYKETPRDKHGLCGLVNRNGDIILNLFEGEISYTDSPNVYSLKTHSNTKDITNIKFGYYNSVTGIYIEPKYDEILGVEQDYVSVRYLNLNNGKLTLEGRPFVLNGEERVLLPEWCVVGEDFHDGISKAVNKDGKWGIIGNKGETICEAIYDSIGDIIGECVSATGSREIEQHEKTVWGETVKKKRIDSYGLVNIGSRIVIPADYDRKPTWNGGFYETFRDRRYGVIDDKGFVVTEPRYESIEKMGDYYLIAETKETDPVRHSYIYKKMVGLLDKNGREIISPQYNEIKQINERFCKGRINEKWALLNEGGLVAEHVYDDIWVDGAGTITFALGERVGSLNNEGRLTVHDSKGDIIEVPSQFEWASDFRNGIAVAIINGCENHIDDRFNIVLLKESKPIYLDFSIDYIIRQIPEGFYVFCSKGRTGLLSAEGSVILPAEYNSLEHLSKDIFVASWSPSSFGVIDTRGNEILPFDYESIAPLCGIIERRRHLDYDNHYFDDNYYNVYPLSKKESETDYWYISQKGETWSAPPKVGLLGLTGDILLAPIYQGIAKTSFGFFLKQEGKWRAYDEHFSLLSTDNYDGFSKTKDGFYRVYSFCENSPRERIGILDSKGVIKLPLLFSSIGDFNDDKTPSDFAVITREGILGTLYGIIRRGYEIVVDAQYESVPKLNDNSWSVEKKVNWKTVKGKVGPDGVFTELPANSDIPPRVEVLSELRDGRVIVKSNDYGFPYCSIKDTSGSFLIPFKYRTIEQLNNGHFRVSVSSNRTYGTNSLLYGILNANLDEIIKPQYTKVEEAGEYYKIYNIIFHYTNVGIADFNGTVVISCSYETIEQASEDLFWIKNSEGKYGLASIKKELLVPPQYKEVKAFQDGLACVLKEYGLWGVIDTAGKEVIPCIYQTIEYNSQTLLFKVSKTIPSSKANNSFYSNSYEKVTGSLNTQGDRVIRGVKGDIIKAMPEYDWQEDYVNGESVVYRGSNKGRVNKKGQFIIHYVDEGVKKEAYLPSRFQWGYDSDSEFVVVEIDEKKGVYSITEDKVIIELEYNLITAIEMDPPLRMLFKCTRRIATDDPSWGSNRNERSCLIKSTGEVLLPLEYREIKKIGYQFFAVEGKENLFSVIDVENNRFVEGEFSDVRQFGERNNSYLWGDTSVIKGSSIAIVQKSDKYGAINKMGMMVLPVEYNRLSLTEGDILVCDNRYFDSIGRRVVSNGVFTVPYNEVFEAEILLENNLVVAKKDGYWGCVNLSGEVIIPFQYDSMEAHGNLFIVSKMNDGSHTIEHGVLNIHNEIIIPLCAIDELSIEKGVIKYKKDYRYGAYNWEGKHICEAIYDEIEGINEFLIKVGKHSTQVDYDEQNDWYSERQVINWGLFSVKGEEILPCEYNDISERDDIKFIQIEKFDLVGLLDTTGRILMKPKYYSIGPFIDSYSVVKGTISVINKKGYEEDATAYGVIDGSLQEIIPCVFSSIEYEKESGMFVTDKGFKLKDGRFVYYLNNERILVPAKYKYCKEFVNDRAIAIKYHNPGFKYGLINRLTEEIMPPIFDSISWFSNGLLRFRLNNLYGIMNRDGHIIYDNQFSSILQFKDDIALVCIDQTVPNGDDRKKFGFIDANGELMLKPEYDIIGKRINGFVRLQKNGLWGFYNLQTRKETIVENISYLGSFFDRRFLFNVGGKSNSTTKKIEGGKWGYLDDNAIIVIAAEYEEAHIFSEERALVKLGGKWGVIDVEGKEIVPFEYDEAGADYKEGDCRLIEGNTIHVFSLDGKEKTSYPVPNQYDDDYYYDPRDDFDYERERWFALTDGQYGDFPGGHPDYDGLGF